MTFDMGDHAPFVWGAYGVAFGIMVLLCWIPRRQFSKTRRMIEASWRREESS